MTTLSEHPRQQLQIIIARFGHSICDNPKRCEAILRDLCPENKREVNLLVTALKEKIAHDLLNRPILMPLEITINNLSQRLQNNHGTAETFANWAVESWALSLAVMQKPLPKKTVKPVKNNSPTQTKTVTSSNPQQQRIGKFIVRDGITLDTETNLIWCRFAYGQTWKNNTSIGDAKRIAWEEAFEVAKRFNQQGGYAGYTDWRLPTVEELKSLIDKVKGKQGDYIDRDVFPRNANWAWSSSPYVKGVSSDNYAWIVDFYSGSVLNHLKFHSSVARFVRNKTVAVAAKPSPQTPKIAVVTPPTTAKFIIPPPSKQKRSSQFNVQDGIAIDTQTGLMWCRFTHGQQWQNNTVVGNVKKVNWQTAFDIAKQFNQQGGYAGFTDWRLPTIAELRTLIDKINCKNANYIDADIFPDNPSGVWSSSSSSNNNYYDAWIVFFNYGYGYYDYKTNNNAVRLVRNV